MTTTQTPEVTITVSAPYRVEGFQGGRYGLSAYTRRTYTAVVLGKTYTNTDKTEIQRTIRAAIFRATGNLRVTFTFTDSQEG